MVPMVFAIAVVLLLCVTSSKLLYSYGVPTLLIFLLLGMLFGSDGPVGIYFDNYVLAQQVCSFGLIFIMFYGGFGTSWKTAVPIAVPAVLLSTLGVAVTAGLTGLFCHFVLHTSLLEGLLIGSVIASTDAASVFAILRSQDLNLSGGLAPLLEIESGSNDPMAYMLTMVVLSLMSGDEIAVLPFLVKQIGFGLLIGFLVAEASVYVLRRINLDVSGLYSILVIAIALFSYSASEFLGGNGYLSVYLVGIALGNAKLPHKKMLVHFFDGISWLMQILLFFVLGLLAFPSQFLQVLPMGVGVAVFLFLIARPAAVFGILHFFPFTFWQKLLVSWVGLRGAASIVFAIFAVTNKAYLNTDIFHIVFLVALLSVSFQGTLLPWVAKRLDLVDNETSVRKTFTDYQEDLSAQLIEFPMEKENPWVHQTLSQAGIPKDILVVMIKRQGKAIVPKGDTEILPGDILVLSGMEFDQLPLS